MATITTTAAAITDATSPTVVISPVVEVVAADDPGWRWASLPTRWLASVRGRTGSERTPAEYGRYVDLFSLWLAREGRTVASATFGDVDAFVRSPLPHVRTGRPGRPPGASAVAVRLAALRSFYAFARRDGLVTGDPTADVDRPRQQPAAPRGLTVDEVRALLTTIPTSASGRRDRAIVTLAVMTGLRRAELLAITAGDVTVDGGVPYLAWRAKGGHVRRRELPRPALDAITTYLAAAGRPLDGLAAADVLFPVTAWTLADNVRRYGAAIGRPDLTVHTLRHTAAKLRRSTGATIEDVQAVLGHASIATTARYLARLDDPRDHGWAAVAGLLEG